MQSLEVSGAVRPLKSSLGVKWLISKLISKLIYYVFCEVETTIYILFRSASHFKGSDPANHISVFNSYRSPELNNICFRNNPTYINNCAKRCKTKQSIILQVQSTCFGRQPHPPSGVHKTVTTASSTGLFFVQLPPSNVAKLGHVGGR